MGRENIYTQAGNDWINWMADPEAIRNFILLSVHPTPLPPTSFHFSPTHDLNQSDTWNVLSPGCQGRQNTEDYKSRWEGEELGSHSLSLSQTHTHTEADTIHLFSESSYKHTLALAHKQMFLTYKFPPLHHLPVSFGPCGLSRHLYVCVRLCVWLPHLEICDSSENLNTERYWHNVMVFQAKFFNSPIAHKLCCEYTQKQHPKKRHINVFMCLCTCIHNLPFLNHIHLCACVIVALILENRKVLWG